MNEENKVTDTETTGEATEQAAGETKGSPQGEKLFTQEEVNSFIQARLGQMKKQATKESMTEYEEKLKELNARELKLTVREELVKRNMPEGLAEIITVSNADEISGKLDKLNEIYGNKETTQKTDNPHGFIVGGAVGSNPQEAPDEIRIAMGLNR